MIVYVVLPHPLLRAKSGRGELLLPALFPSVYIHRHKWKIKHLYSRLSPSPLVSFASPFWGAAAAGLLILFILITLYCVTSAQSQLFGCPFSSFVDCRLLLSLGFAERGICLQNCFSHFPGCSCIIPREKEEIYWLP